MFHNLQRKVDAQEPTHRAAVVQATRAAWRDLTESHILNTFATLRKVHQTILDQQGAMNLSDEGLQTRSEGGVLGTIRRQRI